ncbi:uncharacterized protein LOC144914644 isoform X1 [Branchiostoma floridae x Branchiostoma belcheri]
MHAFLKGKEAILGEWRAAALVMRSRRNPEAGHANGLQHNQRRRLKLRVRRQRQPLRRRSQQRGRRRSNILTTPQLVLPQIRRTGDTRQPLPATFFTTFLLQNKQPMYRTDG